MDHADALEQFLLKGEIDGRHDYVFLMLSHFTGLQRWEIVDELARTRKLEELDNFVEGVEDRTMVWLFKPATNRSTASSPVFGSENGHGSRKRASLHSTATSPASNSPPRSSGLVPALLSNGGSSSSYSTLPPLSSQSNEFLQVNRNLARQFSATAAKPFQLLQGSAADFVVIPGLCIYAIKPRDDKVITEANIHRKLVFGCFECTQASLLRDIGLIFGRLFIPIIYLSHTDLDGTSPGRAAKEDLLNSLVVFESAARVHTETISREFTLPVCHALSRITVFSAEQLHTAMCNPRNFSRIESCFMDWIVSLEKLLVEQQLARQELEDFGPLKEVEYWRIRSALFGNLCVEIRKPQVRSVVALMDANKSRGLNRWKDVVRGIYQEHGFAENVRTSFAIIERQLAPLYLNSPEKLIRDMRLLFNTLKFIHTLSPADSSQRLSPLMAKITTQMIRSCRTYVSENETLTIWNQPKTEVRRKLELCLQLYAEYRKAYHNSQDMLTLEGVPIFTFSTQLVFGKFDAFAKRLQRIIDLLQTYDRYHSLLSSGVEGLLVKEKAIDDMCTALDELMEFIARKGYDCLDASHRFMEGDYEGFTTRLNQMISKIRKLLDKQFACVWHQPQVNMSFLRRFERLNDLIPGLATEKKASLILAAYNDILDRVKQEYNDRRVNPPLPRNTPPVAGSIIWVRGLFERLADPIRSFKEHRFILRRPEAKQITRRYGIMIRTLVQFELGVHEEWKSKSVSNILFSLTCTILVKGGTEEEPILVTNFDPQILAVIKEAECLKKLDLEVPLVIGGLTENKGTLLERKSKAEYLVKRYYAVQDEVPVGFEGLFDNHLHRIDEALEPGLRQLRWTSKEVPAFVKEACDVIEEMTAYFRRARGILARINTIRTSLLEFRILHLPSGKTTWSPETFLEKNQRAAQRAADAINSRNTLMEDSLIELLNSIFRSDPCKVRDLSSVALAVRMANRTKIEVTPSRTPAGSQASSTVSCKSMKSGDAGEENLTSPSPPEGTTLEPPKDAKKELPTHPASPKKQNEIHKTQQATSKDPSSSLPSSRRNSTKLNTGSHAIAKCEDHRARRMKIIERIKVACEELVRYYNAKIVEALVAITRGALEELISRMQPDVMHSPVVGDDDFERTKITDPSTLETWNWRRKRESHPLFRLEATLESNEIRLNPSMDKVHETLIDVGRIILSVSRTVSKWSRVQPMFGGLQHLRVEITSAQKDSAYGGKQPGQLFAKPWMARVKALPEEKYCAVPVRPRNHFKPVTENKEIVKCLTALNACVANLRSVTKAELEKLGDFSSLWLPSREQAVRSLLRAMPPPTVFDFEQKINEFVNLERELARVPDVVNTAPIIISYGTLKRLMTEGAKAWITSYCRGCKIAYKRKLDKLLIRINDMSRRLNHPIRDLDELSIGMNALRQIRENEVDMEMAIDPIEEAFAVVQKHGIRMTREETDRADSLRYTWHTLQMQANDIQTLLANLQAQFQRELAKNLQQFDRDADEFCQAYYDSGPMVNGLAPKEASERLITFQNRFDSLWRRFMVYTNGQELFGMEPTDYPMLGQIKKELNLLQKLYRLYNDVLERVNSYYEILWVNVNIEEINNELMEFQNRCRKLPKGLKEWPAFNSLKKIVDDFADMCPLIELMSNKAMKRRHWDRLSEVTNHKFEVENEAKFSLQHIMMAPLLQHREDIEDICISAVKERDIEAKLRTVTNDWAGHELKFVAFKNRGELLLRGDTTAEIITLLEDSLMVLGSLLSNRYNGPFRAQIQKWVSDLTNASEILERWLFVQNLWVYLEAVFVGGDIAKQLPREAKRFYTIDKAWQKIMSRAHDVPNVVSCCVGDETLKQCLPNLQAELEICQKSLSGYLEKKRMMFPRFFFVSDPALLEILGQASDSHTIQDHLQSIFDNTKSVVFHDQNYDRITAVVSCEGETINLVQPVRAEGSVESWLMRLLQASQSSVHSIIKTAHKSLSDPNFDLLFFANMFPAQVTILGLQMIWTRDAESALTRSKFDKKAMAEANVKCLSMLNVLIAQTTKDLGPVERTKFETLITIHVHQRDIFDSLCRQNIKSITDFEWLKQCRVYFKEDLDKTLIQITDVSFAYQNEFLGCTERLVITPLTDRCYITLAQALGMCMGGSPTGPAGTGKTETTKDMGKTLGKYVVVFNCSDQMDYRGLGRIFKGLAQSGTWGCFDEFNRIELPVLSVAAQQIALILNCKKEKKKSFVFMDGDIIDMNPEFGIFLTMNPGYAGRQELPENLKIQFRTVAMMVPDRQIIIRVKLASCGFLENITLARKFFTLYKLCEEQMTKQVHYDFGLRNILSVLRTLGSAKRANPRDSESTTVMRVLRDMNLSKLIDEDEPLFMSLIHDLFPNVSLDKAGHPHLEKLIDQQIQEAGLVNHPPWTVKLVQLYETQMVRHGIMILGPSGSGKTSCIQILMKALTQSGKPHREMRMNPKAITASQMFGRLDVATNDWTDGIFSALWRRTHKAKKGEHIWIVLDGPVDAIWIENLNSVLDDNKTLTLANGDRIPMSENCKIIFEPDNINNASPATVSRNGMVYMSSSALDWKPMAQAWLKKCPSGFSRNLLEKILDKVFTNVYNWSKHNIVNRMEILQVNIITQLLSLLEGLLPMKKPTEDDSNQGADPCSMSRIWSQGESAGEHVKRVFLFCLMWSVGAVLELEDRLKLEMYLRENEAVSGYLDFPPKQDGFGSSMFDFVVDDTGNWVHWSSRVEEYIFPESSVGPIDFSSVLVPNIDNVRTTFLIQTIAKQKKAILLTGEQGSAKTVIMEAFLKSNNPEAHISRKMNFSSASTPQLFQKSMESYLDKRIGNTYGPPAGKRMTVFIDDISMPQINEWGDQVTNEIVRQTIEMQGFYKLEKPGDFTAIEDVQFVAAMIHPGGGRNDIPSRLKRHFSIFNCTLPTPQSIDKIFGAVATGYYCSKRGFTQEVQDVVAKLVPITRKLWAITKAMLLPTPAKFHYIFNLRDLSRIWQGMVGALPTVVDSPKVLLRLWKHENSRVIADRFTDNHDQEWFNATLLQLVESDLGKQYGDMVKDTPYFVDFLRDAPEPTGEEPEADMDIEMPKVYEPLPNTAVLQDRLKMFLAQHNDMVRGSGMDLVFFNDAMVHIMKISRIIRNPGGNALLVGVGGSGKKSLTQLASFIAGYKTFQITLSRSYNANNFMEDLKVLYRTCGIQGKGTTFIFTDQDVKEESFLEYLNNVLSSGRVSNVFNRDEQSEIIMELIPILKREHPRQPPTPENVLEFFESRVRHNLHVVLCFSPVGEKFRNRANKFPGLFSGCTIDWFQPWPRDALIAVAQHYLKGFELACSPAVRGYLVKAMANVQEVVSLRCVEYFERFRRSAHVTPKSFMTFLNLYKTLYSQRSSEIAERADRMERGLEKLQEASKSVATLKAELSVMEKELEVASKKADEVLTTVTAKAKEAETIRNQVKVKKDDAQVLVDVIAADKALAEEKLEAARPALEEAISALNTIKPAHIATVRKLGRPPHLIMRVLDCVLILFKKRLHPVVADGPIPSPRPSWSESLKFLASTNFLQNLERFPKDTINDEVVELLDPYFSMEDYQIETAQRVCGDVGGLLSWTKSMAVFYGVNKEVLPLKANLAMQEARLSVALSEFKRAEKELRRTEGELSKVRNWYAAAVAERERLCEAALACRRKMHSAETLINGLVGEKIRWTRQSRAFKDQKKRLIGDVVLATAFISYAGPFNQEFRGKLMDTWREIVESRDIPLSDDTNIVSMLVDPPTVSEWHLQGLPNDELSVQNAIIATKASCYPLLIDPQAQGKLWVKNREMKNELQITSLNHKYFRSHLEDSLSLGRPLLIEDVGEELDPILDNLLEKNFIKSGTIDKVLVGDKEFDIMPGFSLFLTTKLSNPSFTPEISAKTAVIDFTVTMKGLEDQLLGRVVLTEKSELEAERVALVEDVLEHKRAIQELEDNLLSKLTSIKGSLVDDEELIAVLASTKATAEEVSQKLKIAAETERKINQVREEFRPVAMRGSTLYFLIVEMSTVNVMYQTSLRQFLLLFELSMSRSPKNTITYVRIWNIINYLTHSVWKFASRGFYERHKFLFTLLLAVKIDLHTERVTYDDFMTLVKGGASLDLKTVPPKPHSWILDVTWLNVVALSRLPMFKDILKQVREHEREWRGWWEEEAPEAVTLPCNYSQTLDAFGTLLLIRSWSPDRTLFQAKKYIEKALGPQFCEVPILDMDEMWGESDCRTPMVCLLALGADPTSQIEALARSREIEILTVSMGQGQEVTARRLLEDCMIAGHWLLLQNCHLSLSFCAEFMETLNEAMQIHGDFRLWLTTEHHLEFPVGLLQMSIKFTNEPPQGIKASLKTTYTTMNQDVFEYSNIPQWQPLLFSIAFLHTIVLERRKYGALGWNVPYDFNLADFIASVRAVQNHIDDLDPKKGISWVTLWYMIGEVQYGGRVTDDFDHHLMMTFSREHFTEKILSPDFHFYPGYGVPKSKSVQGYLDYINSLPSYDSPEVFGLHPNADITYQINTSKEILAVILSIQPKEGSGAAGGETREAAVYKIAEDILSKLPARIGALEIKDAIQNLGGLDFPMNIFLRQELDRMMRVIATVESTLVNLKLAIEGTIIMSESLREAMDAMYDARVPAAWAKISWNSTTLGFWFTELLQRDAQYGEWRMKGRPLSFWMSGMFNPQGFLTAMRQEVTRAHKGWALDSVVVQNIVTKFMREDISHPPPEGVYIHGLYLEGASYDTRRNKLAECRSKVLFDELPVVYVFATNSTQGKDPRNYECPIYRKPSRTDAGYIGSFDFETDVSPNHWALRGVAILCDTK